MSKENIGDQFIHVVGGSLIKEAQDHVQTAIDHVSQYTKPIFDSTPEKDLDKLWENPLFGQISSRLHLAASNLDSATKFHDEKDYISASKMLIATHRNVLGAINADMNMVSPYDPKNPPIEDPKPLHKAIRKVVNSIHEWHELFKGKSV